MPGVSLYEIARVGEARLLGEVVRVEGARATLQVYEETSGLRVGEPVVPTGAALEAELGPGLLGALFDGVGRPLVRLAEDGDFLRPGASAPTLDSSRRWGFRPVLGPGARVAPGDVLGEVEEYPGFVHRIMVPPGVSGELASLHEGEFTVEDELGTLRDGTRLRLSQRWPLRTPRPAAARLGAERPLVTGQRVIDFLFPVAEGGSVAVPGAFGTGKTVIEQALARYARADVVVFIGCGERGNEMAEVLEEFPQLVDPRTGRSVMDRTTLVVNTSNMPVAAREASVYLGISVAEYFRDMGYSVAVMADSLSRWAEALREIAARLQEMPGEEGYPTYLASRLGALFERAGRVRALGAPAREGAVTIIGAVSPPGGDFSEPVTQASLRVTGALWALSPELARQRQFPALDWEASYSLYVDATARWFAERTGHDWSALRRETLAILARDADLREVAGLVGVEALQDRDRLVLEVAALVREVLTGQNASDPNEADSPVDRTYRLASLVHAFYRAALRALDSGAALESLDIASVRRVLVSLRSVPVERFIDAAERAAAVIEAMEGSRGAVADGTRT